MSEGLAAGVNEMREMREALRGTLRSALGDRPMPAADGGAARQTACWKALSDAGLFDVLLPRHMGGLGLRLADVVGLFEEAGRLLLPGPYLPTVVGSLALARLPRVAGLGDAPIAYVDARSSSPAGGVTANLSCGGNATLSGVAQNLVMGPVGNALVAATSADGEDVLCRVAIGESAVVREIASVDITRRFADVHLHQVPAEVVMRGGEATSLIRHLDDVTAVLACAEAVGGSAKVLQDCVAYAKVRFQFGVPIGSFQAIKHHFSDLFVALEIARCVTHSAAIAVGEREDSSPLPAAAALCVADAAVDVATGCLQTYGGIGYTWEHDVHLFLRRALAAPALWLHRDAARRRLEAILVAGPRPANAALKATCAAWTQATFSTGTDLRAYFAAQPSDEIADAVRAWLEHVAETQELPLPPPSDQGASEDETRQLDRWLALIGDAGLATPTWPVATFGIGADEERARLVSRALQTYHLAPSTSDFVALNVVGPTILRYGAPRQIERFVGPLVRREERWCQLFSEPGAGSDLAGLSTRAINVDGGWRLDGTKVWSSYASRADFGLALARTDPSVPKHAGISVFVVPMDQEGVQTRPIRQLTGETGFDEVRLDGARVPADGLLGEVGAGWSVASGALNSERSGIGAGHSDTWNDTALALAWLARDTGAWERAEVRGELTQLYARELAVIATTSDRPNECVGPPHAAVRKLAISNFRQDATAYAMGLQDRAGCFWPSGNGVPAWTMRYLQTRRLTIAGGTSEVLRNVLSERVLGLPKDSHSRIGNTIPWSELPRG
jgi:alkylation response protein AidB-like acyl-CoA dehydrogenase